MFKKYLLLIFLSYLSLLSVEVVWEEKEKTEKNLPEIYQQFIQKTYPNEIKIYKEYLVKKEIDTKEEKAWNNIKDSSDYQKIKTYINKYPNSKYIKYAKELLSHYNPIVHNEKVYYVVKSPYTKRHWLDRNLGASRVCISHNDKQCYGDYFQWGRSSDGHE